VEIHFDGKFGKSHQFLFECKFIQGPIHVRVPGAVLCVRPVVIL